MNKKYEVAVNLQQDFTASEQTQGRNNIGACDNANIAPAYTNKTYEANSYVMHDGILYTNENAITTSENWTPAHWNQTTVAEMMAGSGKKWTHRTENLIIGSLQQIDIQDHEYVDLTVAKGIPGQGTVNLQMHLYGECYIRLNKSYNVLVNTYVGDSNTATTDVNTGFPTLQTSKETAVILNDSSIPDSYDPDMFSTMRFLTDAYIQFVKPSLASASSAKALLHFLGEGTLIITPLPD